MMSRLGGSVGCIVLAVTLSGCAVMTKWYVQPGTDGQVARCHQWGWGWLGTPLAIVEHHACRSKLENLGFVPVSESDVRAAAHARCANQWPGDLGRQVLCREQYMEALKKGRPSAAPEQSMSEAPQKGKPFEMPATPTPANERTVAPSEQLWSETECRRAEIAGTIERHRAHCPR